MNVLDTIAIRMRSCPVIRPLFGKLREKLLLRDEAVLA
jgi:hypothetical protein